MASKSLPLPGGAPNTPPNGPQPSVPQTERPFVAFKPDNVPPSQAIYLQLNDVLFLRFLGNVNGVILNVNYRYLTPQGEIKEGVAPFTSQTNLQSLTIPLGEVWLLSVVIQAQTSGPTGTWTHIQLGIARGIPTVFSWPVQGIIWEGYVYNNGINGWPGTPSKESWDGAGVIRSITGTAPGAGVEISELVPSNRRWTLISFRAVLHASANVANRFPRVFIDDGANNCYLIGTSVAQVASTNVGYHFTPGSQFYNDTNASQILPAPDLLPLKAGFHIKTNTVALQANDFYDAPQYVVVEWGDYNS
jgi:hypothetical protein